MFWKNMLKMWEKLRKTYFSEKLVYEVKEWSIFQKQAECVFEFLKQHNKKSLSVCLVIGPKNSGKTSFLENSYLNFLLKIPETSNFDSIEAKNIPDYFCRWYITDEILYLEIPDYWNNNELEDLYLWQNLFTTFQRKSKYLDINYIVTILPVDIFLEENIAILNSYQERTQKKLQLLNKLTKKNLIMHRIAISKIDSIEGAEQFFSEIKSQDTLEELKISLLQQQKVNFHVSANETFDKNFSGFFQNLSSNIFSQLNQEFEEKNRIDIMDFLFGLCSLKGKVKDILKQCYEKLQYQEILINEAINFASAKRGNYHYQFIETLPDTIFSKKTKTEFPHKKEEYNGMFVAPLFIFDLVKENKSSNFSLAKFKRMNLLSEFNQVAFYGAISAIFILSLSFYFGISWTAKQVKYQEESYNRIVTEISHLAMDGDDRFYLDLINILNESNNITAFVSKAWVKTLGLGTHLSKKLEDQEQNLISQLLYPRLQKYLENTLQQQNLNFYQKLLNFKIYLMLHDKTHFNETEVRDWFYTSILNEKISQEKLTVLTQALKSSVFIKPMPVRQNIIEQTQQTINALPLSLSFYELLKEKYINNFGFMSDQEKLLTHKIPYFFSTEGFSNLFLPLLARISENVQSWHWVLGSTSIENEDSLRTAIIQNYFQDYRSYWNNNVSHPFPDLTAQNDLKNYFDFVLSSQGFEKKLKLFSNNLNPKTFIDVIINKSRFNNEVNHEILNQVTLNIAEPFEYLKKLIDFSSQNLTDVSRNFIKQHIELQTINNQMSPEFSFDFAKKEFMYPGKSIFKSIENQTHDYPGFCQEALQNIVSILQQKIFSQSSIYINEQWQKKIMPIYNSEIASRYPVEKNSSKDIDLDNFIRFFGPNGVLENFYETYLTPFVDTSGSKWLWKKIDNNSLQLNAKFLETFERARIIKEMFFPNHTKALDVNFSLSPISIQSMVMSVDLNLAGETAIYHPNSDIVTHFAWPNKETLNNSSIVFYLTNQETAMNSSKGPWSIFKLFDQSLIESTRDPKRYYLTFAINQVSVKYELDASESINPFIPGILDRFRCEKNIVYT